MLTAGPLPWRLFWRPLQPTDSIKALIGRLQIPVLKAAMLDGAFFSKKSHPSRLLVNALAEAGIGWSPTMGQDDPLYRKIEQLGIQTE